MKAIKESERRKRMSVEEAKEMITEPIYEGMMESLIVEISKERIAHRLSKHGTPLPSWIYEQADQNVEELIGRIKTSLS